MRKVLLAVGALVGLVVVAALVVIALSLRTVADEEKKQTACARSQAVSQYWTALYAGDLSAKGRTTAFKNIVKYLEPC